MDMTVSFFWYGNKRIDFWRRGEIHIVKPGSSQSTRSAQGGAEAIS